MIKLPVVTEQAIMASQVAARDISAEFEANLAARGAIASCKKGCTNCCYYPVYISVLEGAYIYQWLIKHQLWSSKILVDLQKHSAFVKNLKTEVWMLSGIACPLLREGLCSVHKVRPFSCRIAFSEGDPKYCHPQRLDLATGMVSKASWLEKYQASEQETHKAQQAPYFKIPLSDAILQGKRLIEGEITLQEAYLCLIA